MKRIHLIWYNYGDKSMVIDPNSTVVVYMNIQEKYYQSVYSRFEVLYQEYKLVGYIEDLGVLCCGFETVYYDMNKYVNDIMYCDFEEMTYDEYIRTYQGKLAADNPGAPSLNDSPAITFGTSRVQEAPMVREVLNSNPILQNLNDKGIKVQILKG